MKISILKILSSVILVTGAIMLQSCNKEWKKHYKDEPSEASDVRLADYIKSEPTLSTFYQMLAITGYDKILNASQTYTVWAPLNDALQNIDLNDTAQVLDIVKNHIARYSYSTSGIQSKYIRMLNGKLILFSHDVDGYHFGSALMTSSDKLLGNGIVHQISSYVPFQNNIWEFISRTPGLDSLKAYISSQQKKVFNIDASTAVGVDSFGNTVYDSVFYEGNVLFNSIGHFNLEDSIYTAILPDNTAWNAAYNTNKLYFVSDDPTKGTQIQRYYTQLNILWDAAFRHRIYNPTSFDSLVTTTRDVFHQPGYLFNNVVPTEVSNGLVYLTSQWQYKPIDSWFSKIKVEAESSYGRNNLNSNIYLRYSFGSSLDISNKAYIVVEPTTISSISKVYVDFAIPSTLSAKYNIYCVFVPGTLPNRALFYLLTVNSVGKILKNQQLFPANNVTNPNGITKMLVAENFKIPYCDLTVNDNSSSSNLPKIRLRVQNDVNDVSITPGDSTLSRTMRIDYVSFEPVGQ